LKKPFERDQTAYGFSAAVKGRIPLKAFIDIFLIKNYLYLFFYFVNKLRMDPDEKMFF